MLFNTTNSDSVMTEQTFFRKYGAQCLNNDIPKMGINIILQRDKHNADKNYILKSYKDISTKKVEW